MATPCLRWLIFGTTVWLTAIAVVRADDNRAQAQLLRWANAVQNADRIAVRFQVRRIDHWMQREHVGVGRYYRDGADCWRLTIRPPMMEPVSALRIENGRERPLEPMASETTLCTPHVLYLGTGDPHHFQGFNWPAVSARELENSPPLGAFLRWPTQAELIERTILLHEPLLFFANQPQSAHFKAELQKADANQTWLQLTVRPDRKFHVRFCQVDAVFDPATEWPHSLRLVDFFGRIEYRLAIQSVTVNEHAQIPKDAFDPPKALTQPVGNLAITVEWDHH